ncbi:XdhC family protein [Mycoplasmatota bacterium]|nr:XdhC family protein [Mycoplasmatota bacterium]
MNVDVIGKLNEAIKDNIKVAYVTLTKSTGSAPGRTGNTMLVYEDGSIVGTCGGGNVEYTMIQEALECMKNNTPKSFKYKLEDIGMVCGGEVEGFIDVMKNDKNLIIVGGGHIGSKLYSLALELGFTVTVVDDREEFANKDKYPEAKVFSGEYKNILSELTINDSYVVIVSRGHDTDYESLRSLIQRDYKYLGLIGSKRKVIKILGDLKEEGINSDDYENLYAPIGLDIARNEPAEIALSIMAEILLIKNNGTLKHMRKR